MLTEWHTISLYEIKHKNREKSTIECFEILINELRRLQRGLALEYKSQNVLRDRIINSCRDVKECTNALLKPANTVESQGHKKSN
ncbi:hypothetical protein HI914_03766 [Erysiphe necator]|nr:hypothetical protein HI914_05077 [Erysiphe necator]KAI6247559.1 hypothetical protein HI914_03791 [Erysiphe necator]KAI6248446.1 hypothetical protein HI914_03766 [Erysiphe necator]